MSSHPARPGPRYQALIQLLRTADTLWNASRTLFGRWGLSPSQFNILNLLHGQPGGMSQVELSRRLLMHRSNVTGLIDRLERRRLVLRRDQPGDRRAYRVAITPAGRALMRDLLPRYHRAAEEVWGPLPLQRARQLVRDLEEVSAHAERAARKIQQLPAT
ncbi:MAG: MarR family transcriptional regulator [Verrucomicrobia bacterium]|nr:MarR family transcriptional regulator [Verrucomicrobiota bacterium]